MADGSDVMWLVGHAAEVGSVQEQLGRVDATVQETWPGGVNAGVVVLVRSAAAQVDDAAAAFARGAERFPSEEEAREAALRLAGSSS